MTLDELLIHTATLEDENAIFRGALREIMERSDGAEAYSALGQCRAAAVLALKGQIFDDKTVVAARKAERAAALRAELAWLNNNGE